MSSINLWNDAILVGIWIGMWGIGDNIINIYIPIHDYKKRIIIFAVIYAISLFLLYLSGGVTINL